MPKERGIGTDGEGQRPRGAFELPAELAEFLGRAEYAMLTHATDQGTVFVVKAPGREIRSIAGRVPFRITHELHQHELAPVIRTVVRIYDQPDRPLALESFINVDEPEQWADYANLTEQEDFLFLFYDETLSHRLSKRVPNTAGDQMRNILNWADRTRASILDERYDFNAAKADVMRRVRL